MNYEAIEAKMNAEMQRISVELWRRYLLTCVYCGAFDTHEPWCTNWSIHPVRFGYVVETDPGCLDGPRAPYDPGGAESLDDDEECCD